MPDGRNDHKTMPKPFCHRDPLVTAACNWGISNVSQDAHISMIVYFVGQLRFQWMKGTFLLKTGLFCSNKLTLSWETPQVSVTKSCLPMKWHFLLLQYWFIQNQCLIFNCGISTSLSKRKGYKTTILQNWRHGSIELAGTRKSNMKVRIPRWLSGSFHWWIRHLLSWNKSKYTFSVSASIRMNIFHVLSGSMRKGINRNLPKQLGRHLVRFLIKTVHRVLVPCVYLSLFVVGTGLPDTPCRG